MIGVGIVGIRGIGRIHAQAVAGVPELGRLIAFTGGDADTDTATADTTGLDPALRTSVDALLRHADVDVVVVCSPSHTHVEVARAALRAGKHVVAEKPLALTASDAASLIADARAHGVQLTAIAQRRYEPLVREIGALLQSGRLGTPVLAEAVVAWHRTEDYYAQSTWRGRAGSGGGSLANQGLHSLDLLLALLGDVIEVTSQNATLAHDIEVEDTSVATVRFASGALGVVATTTAAKAGLPERISVHTTRGSLRLDGTELTLWEFDDVPRPGHALIGDQGPGQPQGPDRNQDQDERIASAGSDPLSIGTRGHLAQWRDILESWRDGRAPLVTAEHAAHTTAVIEAIMRSAVEGRAIVPNGVAA